MKPILLPLVSLAALFASPALARDRVYSVTDFDRIVIEGPYIVRLETGGSASARASGDQEALDRATIDVSGQTLRIRRNRSHWGGNPEAQQGPLVIHLRTRNLRSARLIGPASLEVDGVRGLRVDLSVEGSGRLRASGLDSDQLSIGLAGSGRIELSGEAKTLNLESHGSGDVAANALRADNAAITTTSSGHIVLEAGRAATVTAAGLGTVTVTGRPACTLRGANTALVQCGSDQR